MPFSHHSHSGQFCKHASGTLEEVVKEAIRQHFQVYGLTEHVPRYRPVDLYPEEVGMTPEDLATMFLQYVDEAHRLKSLYAPDIKLLIGLETEYITGLDLDNLERLLERLGHRVEYLIGSIHHVNGIPIDFDMPTYQSALASCSKGANEDQQLTFLSAYFDAQYQILARFKPEIVGHFDLCRLYCSELELQVFPEAWEKVERNIRFAVEYGALFEINAAAFRKGWNSGYPAEDVIQAIKQAGGRFTLSDDSHGPNYVGLNYHRLPPYLQSVGITELWYLEPSETPNAAGRNIRAVKLDGDWLTHKFWRK